MIKNAVENYLSEQSKGTRNPRIDGEVPILGNYIKRFSQLDFASDGVLSEWLIETDPIDKTIEIISRRFNLDTSQIQKQEMNDRGNTVTLLLIILPITTPKDELGKIANLMRTCGYFPNKKFEPYLYDNSWGILTFEPKFFKRCYRQQQLLISETNKKGA